VTALTEERCRTLIERLCSGLGWNVRPEQGMPYVLFTGEGRWIAFGRTWSEAFACLYDNVRVFAMSPDVPAWTRPCGSPEELAMKIEVVLP